MTIEKIKEWKQFYIDELQGFCTEILNDYWIESSVKVLDFLKKITDIPFAFSQYSSQAETVIKNEIEKLNAKISAITTILQNRQDEELGVKNN